MKRYILLLALIIQTLQKSDVYFTKEITPEKIVEMFKKLEVIYKVMSALKFTQVKKMVLIF